MSDTVISYPKNSHVKLKGAAYSKLKLDVFNRDEWTCQVCGRQQMLTLGHIVHRGAGGKNGPGDVMLNCETLCMVCHDMQERGKLIGHKKK